MHHHRRSGVVRARTQSRSIKLSSNHSLKRGALLAAATAALSMPLFSHAADRTWDADGTVDAVFGGTGNWDLTNARWFDGTADVLWNNGGNDNAFFMGTTGTITATTPITARSLNFQLAGFTLSGSPVITLVNAGAQGTGPNIGSSINAVTGATVINASIDASASGTLTKFGTGSLTLNGTANVFTSYVAAAGSTIFGTGAVPGPLNLTLGSVGSASITFGTNAVTLNSVTVPYAAVTTTTAINTGAAQLTLAGNVSYNPNHGSAGSVPLTIGGTGSLNLGSVNRTFDALFNSNLTFGGDIIVSVPVLGSGGITKTGTGILSLTSNAGTFSGGVDVQSGGLFIGNAATGSPGAVTAGPVGTGVINMGANSFIASNSTTARTVLNNMTASGQFSVSSLTLSGSISVPSTGRGISAIPLAVGAAGTINGAISGSGAAPLELNSIATGTLVFTSAQSYTFPTTVNGGTVIFTGATAALSNTSALNLNAGLATINTAAVPNRFNDTAAVNFGGGALIFSGVVAAGGYTEVMGDLNFTGAHNVIGATSSGSADAARLSFTNVMRTNRATGVIGATSLGQNGTFGVLNSGNSAYVKISETVTNEPAFISSMVGGGAAWTTISQGNSIVPWLVGGTSSAGSTTFLTYDSTKGFVALASGNYTAVTSATSGVSTNNGTISTAATLAAPATVNSLWIGTGGSVAGSALTLTSGALASSVTSTNTAPILFGPSGGSEAVVTVPVSTSVLTLNGALTTTGLTKAGLGTLVLGADNSATMTGDIIINQGPLVFTADNQLGAAGNNIRLYQSTANLVYNGGADLSIGRTVTVAPTTPATLSVITVNANTLTLTQPIQGAGAAQFLKTGAGSLTASIGSSVTGLVRVGAGFLTLTGDNSASSGTTDIFGGSLRISANNNLTGGPAFLNGGSLVTTSSATFSKNLNVLFSSPIDTQANSPTLSGDFLPSPFAVARPGVITKQGTGSLTFTGTHSAQVGSYSVVNGAMVFAGANGSAPFVGSFSVAATNPGSRLVLDNSTLNNDRIRGDATISLAGSATNPTEFLFKGNSSVSANESVGFLVTTAGTSTISNPGSMITMDPNGSTAGTSLTFAGYNAASFTLFRGTNLGVDPGTLSPGTPWTSIFFTVPPTLTSGFITGARYDSSLSGLGVGSATYSSNFGLQFFQPLPVVNANYVDNTTGHGTATPINADFFTNADTTVYTVSNAAGTGAGSMATVRFMTVGNTATTPHNVTLTEIGFTPGAGTLLIDGGALTTAAGATGASTISDGTISFGSMNGVITTNSDLIINSVIAGSNGITKAGTASLTLGGANIYSGNTTISAGRLRLGASGVIPNSSIILGAGSFDLNGFNETVGALGGSGSVLLGASNLTVQPTGTSTHTGIITGTGQLVMAGSGTQALSGANTFTGGVVVNSGTVGIDSAGAIPSNTNITINTGGAVRIGTSVANSATPVGSITINGGTLAVPSGSSDYYANTLTFTGGAFSEAGSTNFWFHMKPSVGSTSAPAINILSSPNTVVWTGVTSGSRLQNEHTIAVPIEVANGASAIDLDSSMVLSNGGTNASAFTFIKTGPGTMRITNTNNTASMSVNGGVLRIDDVLALGSGNFGLDGGALAYGGATASTAKNIAIGSNNGTVEVINGASNLTLSGVLSGAAGGLTKTGPGTLVLSNTNTYVGGTTVNAGVLSIANDNNLGAAAGALTLGGGTLRTTAAVTSTRNIALTTATSSTFNANSFASTFASTSGSGDLAFTGGGGVTFSGNYDMTGLTSLTGTSLTLGQASGTVNLRTGAGGSDFAGNLVVVNPIRVNFNQGIFDDGVTDGGPAIQVQASGTVIATADLAPGATITNDIQLNSLSLGGSFNTFIGAGNSSTLTINGAISGSSDVSFSSDGTPGAGGGVVVLGAANTYSGTSTMSLAPSGVVRLGIDNGLPTTTDLNLATGSNGALDLAGFNQSIDSLSSSPLVGVNGIANTGGSLSTLTITGSDTTSYSSHIGIPFNVTNLAGANNNIALVLSATHTGMLTLADANTYTGGTTVNGGVLRISNDNNIGGASGGLTLGGGTLRMTSGITSTRNIALTSSTSSTLDPSGFISTFGSTSGAGDLGFTGGGGVTFSGNYDMTGLTTLNATNLTLGQASGTVNLRTTGTGTDFNGSLVVVNPIQVNFNAGNFAGGGNVQVQSSGTTLGTGSGNTATIGNAVALNSLSLGGSFGTTIDTASASILTISGVVSGTSDLTKVGPGTLVLSGTNTYVGGTTVNAGVLSIANDNNLGAAAGALTLGGGTLRTTAAVTSTRNIALTTATSSTFDANSFASTFGSTSGSGDLAFTGGGGVTFSGNYDMTGITTLTGTNLTLGQASGTVNLRTTGTGSDFAGNLVIVNPIQVNFNQGTFDDGVADGGPAIQVQASGTVIATANSAPGATITNDIMLNSLNLAGTFSTTIGAGDSSTLTINGQVSGNSDVNFASSNTAGTGAGVLVLGAANTWSGKSTINNAPAGVVRMGAANSLPSGSDLIFGSGSANVGALDLNGFNLSVDSLASSTTGTINGIANTGGATTLTVTGADTTTYAGTIGIPAITTNLTGANDNIALTLSSAHTGVLTLSGVNTYTGGTTINGGVLSISNDNNIGNASGALTMGGGTLRTTAGVTSTRNIALTTATSSTFDANTFASTFASTSGSGNLAFTGGGGVTFSGNYDMTGLTTLNTTNLTLGQATGTVNLRTTGTGTDFNGNLTIVNPLTVNFNAGNFSGGGNVQVQSNGTTLGVSTSNSVTIGNAVALNSLSIGGSFGTTIDTASLSTLDISGIVSGTSDLTKVGPGTLVLGGTNTYAGNTTLNAGILSISNDNNLGNASGALTLGGGTLRTTAGVTSTRNIALTTATSSTFDTVTNNSTFASTSGSGDLAFTGGGGVAFSGNYDMTGLTTLNATNLTLGQATGTVNLRTTGTGTDFNGNLVVVNPLTVNFNAGNFSGGGNVQVQSNGTTLGVSTANNVTIGNAVALNSLSLGGSFGTTVDTASSSILTISGVVSGLSDLTKVGPGTLVMSGTNTYTGNTTVNAGILSIANDNNLGNASGALTLGGGTLRTTAAVTSTRNIALTTATSSTFDANSFASTFGSTSGSGDLAFTGGGGVTFSGNYDMTGITTLTGTNLTLGQASGTVNLRTTGTGSDFAGNLVIVNPIQVNFNQGTFDDGVADGGPAIQVQASGTVIATANSAPGATITNDIMLNSLNLAGTFSTTIGAGDSSTLTINGQVSGNSDVNFASSNTAGTGAGVLVLGAANTWSGKSTINNAPAGVVRMGAANSLPSGSDLIFGSGSANVGALDLNGFNLSVDSLASSTTGTINGIANTGGATTLTVTGADTTTYAGTIGIPAITTNLTGANDNIALTLSSAHTGVLTLSGVNTYTGGTTINGGVLSISNDNNIGNASGALTMGGGTLRTTAAITSTRNIALTASTASTIDTVTNSSTFASTSGAGDITFTGGGAVAFSGNYASTGLTRLNNANLTLGQASGIVNLRTGTSGTDFNGNLIVANAIRVNFNAGNFSGGGNVQVPTSGTTLSTEDLSTGATIGNAVALNSNSFGGAFSTNVGAGDQSTLNVGGVVSGTSDVVKNGLGSLVLGGTNTYVGLTSVNDGVLSVSNNNNLGNAANNIAMGGGTLRTTGGITSTRNMAMVAATSSTIHTAGNNSTFAATSGSGDITITGGGGVTFTGNYANTGLTKLNNANLTLAQASGTVNLRTTATGSDFNGNLVLVNPIRANFNVGSFAGGGNVQVQSSGSTLASEDLSTGGSVGNPVALNSLSVGGAFSTNIGAGDQSTVAYNGVISGNSDVNLMGDGIAVLGAVNTYVGSTTMSMAPAGVARLGVTNAMPVGTSLVFGSGANNVGAVDLAGFNQSVSSLASATTGSINGIANTGGSTSTMTVTGSSTTTYAGRIGIPANTTNLPGANNNLALALSSAHTGQLTLSAANTYTGGTTINGGALSVGVDGNLGGASGAVNFGGGSLRLNAAGFNSPSRPINVNAGGGSIDTGVNNASVLGAITGPGTLTKLGSGQLVATNVRSSGLTINQGNVQISLKGSSATPAGTSVVNDLTLAGGTTPTVKLDITDNAFVVDYAPFSDAEPFDTIRAQIVSGYNGGGAGAWTGNGITTSLGNATQFAVGYAESAEIFTSFPASFAGVQVDNTSVVFRHTLYGDATLDGKVNLADYNRLALNYNGTGKNWSDADFNFDGFVNLADYNRLAANFNLAVAGPGVTPEDWAALAAAVPEPTTASLLMIGVSGLLRRRRRN